MELGWAKNKTGLLQASKEKASEESVVSLDWLSFAVYNDYFCYKLKETYKLLKS